MNGWIEIYALQSILKWQWMGRSCLASSDPYLNLTETWPDLIPVVLSSITCPCFRAPWWRSRKSENPSASRNRFWLNWNRWRPLYAQIICYVWYNTVSVAHRRSILCLNWSWNCFCDKWLLLRRALQHKVAADATPKRSRNQVNINQWLSKTKP